jgi:predicted DNA-binding protein
MTSQPYFNIPPSRRSSKRISVTVPHHIYEFIVKVSAEHGRSISNLTTYLLESYIEEMISKGRY